MLERRRVFADVYPPHVVEGARAQTVDTFTIVGTNDGVGEGSPGLEEEDSIRVTSFDLLFTG